MGRSFYETTQTMLLEEVKMKGGLRMFVKPKNEVKKFTGRVITTLYDVQSLPSDTYLYVCDCVHFMSEFRFFVQSGCVIGIQCYKGDPCLQSKLNMVIIKKAIDDLESSPYKTAAYALDFGLVSHTYKSEDSVTTDYKDVDSLFDTLLVEWNDAYSLGSYGFSSQHYTDMLIARWQEVARHVQHISQQN